LYKQHSHGFCTVLIKLMHKELTGKIIQAFYEVHNILGPGYLESIYKNALVIELQKRSIRCETERLVEIFYCEKKGVSIAWICLPKTKLL